MSKHKYMPETLISIAIPALMSACASHVILRAMGIGVSWLMIYFAAFITVSPVMLSRRNMIVSITAAVIPIVGTLAAVLMGGNAIKAMIEAARANGGLDKTVMAAHSEAGVAIAWIMALLSGTGTALLYRSQLGRPFALLFPITGLLIGLTFSPNLSIWCAVPGLVMCVAAFSSTGNALSVRPAALAACACIALTAVILSPAAGTTWEPLRQLAEKIRLTADDYVHFTEERVAYSINEMGFDHGGMVSDTVVTMLGGEADPKDDRVMRVETDTDILLRGTIKQAYTGYSWVDERVKARYLYYDFTHATGRSKIFGSDIVKNNSGFKTVNVSVKMLGPGTSTLFVPAHMTEFDMDLASAVYYNSIGEVFLTRDVQAGDTYSLSARVPVNDEQLIAAAAKAERVQDADYLQMQAEYTALPNGISERVYSMTMSITENAVSPAEKALAIRKYLAKNYKYTLHGSYPMNGEDFVSWFLLSEKKGYCSYFATAMTIMCRIAGIPARYVEGYYVHASEGGTIVTGHNAHAWVEIYLNGIGWTAYDPTAAAYSTQYGAPLEESTISPNSESGKGGDTGSTGTPFENEDETEDSSSENSGGNEQDPDEGDDNGSDNGSEDSENDGQEDPDGSDSDSDDNDSENDENDPEEDPENEPEDEPEDQPEDEPESSERSDDRNRFPWLIVVLIALILAALIAVGVRWVRKRLEETDPLRMCKRSRNARKAAMILYRAILTLLVQLGYAPMNGEMPEDFAARVCQSIPNDAYERFVAAAVRSVYSGASLKRSELEDGRDAYLTFLQGMKRTERIRYDVRRVLNGIGDTESIP